MRGLITEARLREFMRELGRRASEAGRVYLVGGASAVLLGWRNSTVDVDLSLEPESDALLRAIPDLKERLSVNVELAAPSHFVPELPGWRTRSRYIASEGRLDYFHYDFYSQAFAKIERGHEQDREDVASMIDSRLVDRARLLQLFAQVEDELTRYPAIDPATLRRAMAEVLDRPGEGD